MRKILFKKWIPAIIEPTGQFTSKKKEGTGCFSNDFTEKGVFLHWGISYEESAGCVGMFSVCFVELSDGTIKEVHPSNIKFID